LQIDTFVHGCYLELLRSLYSVPMENLLGHTPADVVGSSMHHRLWSKVRRPAAVALSTQQHLCFSPSSARPLLAWKGLAPARASLDIVRIFASLLRGFAVAGW